ncbi:hypothetical protein BGZ76_006540 [Entomortierella beljakovae]|nr:hypothetical protein BGZ76_006540 [Entomortierella beljakovae]
MTPTSNVTDNDLQLFGRPSVIGSYNLTTGIVVNSLITLSFLTTLIIATYKRAQFRKQFRRDTEKAGFVEAGRAAASGKGGKGGKEDNAKSEDKTASKPAKPSSPVEPEIKEKSARDVQPTRQESIRRGLLEDAGAAGGLRRSNSEQPSRSRLPDFYKTRTNNDDDGSNRSVASNGSGRGKLSQPQPQPRNDRDRYDTNVRPQLEYEPSLGYDFPEDATEYNDYSAPPLTASSLEDAYYSGFAANAQAYQYQYSTPQAPQPAYQTPRPLQPIKRSDSNRNFSDTQLNRSLSASSRERERERQRPRVATQGLVDRNGSRSSSRSNSSLGSRSGSNSPVDRFNSNRYGPGSPVASIEMENYPAQIYRSNSARLPSEMKKGYDRSYAPSGLSQTQIHSGNGNYM